jgi:two-component system chemotaxis response regulator CheB
LSPFTCPDCHGVLLSIKDGDFARFRCHTGHAYSPDSLLTTLSENVEDSIWNAVRALEENVMLLNHLGKHLAETGKQELSDAYFAKAKEAENRIHMMRQTAMKHEKLNAEKILQDSAAE